MPDYCSCGAELPPDALFCHKCGKPQRDIVEVEPQPEPVAQQIPPDLAPPVSEAAAPTFRNPVAIRIALMVGLGATFLGMLPFVNWLAAGFFAVFFYRRRTMGLLSVNAGLHLGWITGVIMFTMWSIVFAALAAMGQLHNLFKEQFKNMPANDPYVQQLSAFVQSPSGVFVMLVLGFVLITCFSMAGGALGAKVVGRR